MKKMVICWIIVVGGLIGVLTYIGITYEKSVNSYKSLESDLIESADAYIKIKNINLAIDEKMIITAGQMREDDIIKNLSVDSDECTGYVEVKKNINKTDYKAYISCKEYTTEGYNNKNNSKKTSFQ